MVHIPVSRFPLERGFQQKLSHVGELDFYFFVHLFCLSVDFQFLGSIGCVWNLASLLGLPVA
jgi:hypothetical protein